MIKEFTKIKPFCLIKTKKDKKNKNVEFLRVLFLF